ncbi:acyltransferase [Pseudomonas corrugata]|uniref:acyltransferase family protein n=1 Tax=Pseudomonas corrugata TaxID=47879 RepID=UPI00083E58C6|nr:acyltransferase [Pseudomonas corrugata]AOE63802.1 hypothetical protein AXG94_19235 [Pseudomonas corrugata]
MEVLTLSRITPDQSRQLDSIRALSAFVVLLGHTNQTMLLPTLKSGSTFVGFFTQLSVMVFFVLSGFLIGKSVCNNITKNNEFSIAQYARDRALRLYPPLIAAIVLMVLLAALAPLLFPSGTQQFISIPGATFVRTEFAVIAKQLFAALAFLNEFKTSTPSANGPLWSLSLEAWYYVVAAALFAWPSRKLVSIALLVTTVLVTRKNQLFFMLAPIWFAGFGLAFFHQRRPEMDNRLFGVLFAILTVATLAAVVLVLFADPLGKGIWLDRMNHFRLVSGLWFACFMALIMGGGARFPTIFHSHACYSYTLYVIHFPVMLFILGAVQTMIYGSVSLSLLASMAAICMSVALAKAIASYAENKQLSRSIASRVFGVVRTRLAK